MTEREALKMALNKAFQLGQKYWSWADSEYSSHWEKANKAKADFEQLIEDTLKEFLAQPEQEPVVRWMCKGCGHEYMEAPNSCDCMDSTEYERIEYFTTPPQRTWVGLTDEETDHIIRQPHGGADPQEWVKNLASALEAKLKEKNT